MKSIIFTILLLVASSAFAAEENVSSARMDSDRAVSPHILKGNMQVGGGFSYRQNSGGGETSSSYGFYPQVEYFVMDYLSLGGALDLFGQSGRDSYTGYGIGPSLSYYFYHHDNIATYLSQKVLFSKFSEDSKTYSSGVTALGVNFFVVPQVAFGVALSTNYKLDDRPYSTNTTDLTGNFSFFY